MQTWKFYLAIALSLYAVGFLVSAYGSIKMLGFLSKEGRGEMKEFHMLDARTVVKAILFVLMCGLLWPVAAWFRVRHAAAEKRANAES